MLTPLWALAKEEAEKASRICLNPSKLPMNDFLRLGLYTGKDAKAGEGVWWEPWFCCTVEGRAKGGSSWSPWNHAPQFHTSPATFLELEKEAFLCRSRSRPRVPSEGNTTGQKCRRIQRASAEFLGDRCVLMPCESSLCLKMRSLME